MALALAFAVACVVGLAAPALARADNAVVQSYTINTYRDPQYGTPPNGTASTAGCYFILTLHFAGDIDVTDASALDASLDYNGSGGVSGIGARTYTVEAGDPTALDVKVPFGFLPGGVIDITATTDDGVLDGITAGGDPVAWTEIHTVVPTGLTLATTSVTVGSATTPASTTVTVTQQSLVRAMNNIVWLSNGASIVPLPADEDGTWQTTAAHAHMFWSMTTTDAAASIQENAVDTLGALGYTVTQSDNTVTITADVPRPGQVLDVASYDDHFLQANGAGIMDYVSGLSWPNVATDISVPETASTGSPVTPAISFGTGGESYDDTTTPAATYANNTAANNTPTGIHDLATASVTLANGCTYTVPFVIYQAPSTSWLWDLSQAGGMLPIPDLTYTGSAITPDVNAYDYSPGSGLTEGTDFVTEYYQNTATAAADSQVAPTVEIVGIGDYYGSTMGTFTIAPKSLANADIVVTCPSAVEYTGARLRPVTVRDSGDGATLVAGTDYTITYANNVAVGRAVYVIDGLGNYAGEVTGSFRIAHGIEGATVSLPHPTAVYTGLALTPSPVVTLSATTLAAGTDYTVAYAHNTRVGLATMTVTGIGAYTGTATATFVIVPAKAALAAVTPGAKKAVVSWKTSAGGVSGYQVAYAKAGGAYRVAGTTTARSKTVTGLKTGVTYSFKVRAFVKVGGTTYYGAWSSIKRAKTA